MLGVSRAVKSGFVHLSVHDTTTAIQSRRGQRWHRRYLTVFDSGRVTVVSDDKAGAAPIDVFELLQCRQVVLVDENLLNAPYVIGLQFTHKTYYIRTNDQTDLQRWEERLTGVWRVLHEARADSVSVGPPDPAHQAAFADFAQAQRLSQQPLAAVVGQNQNVYDAPPAASEPAVVTQSRIPQAVTATRQSAYADLTQVGPLAYGGGAAPTLVGFMPSTQLSQTPAGPSVQPQPQPQPQVSNVPVMQRPARPTNRSGHESGSAAADNFQPRYTNVPLPPPTAVQPPQLSGPAAGAPVSVDYASAQSAQSRVAISPSSTYVDSHSPTASVMTVRTASRKPNQRRAAPTGNEHSLALPDANGPQSSAPRSRQRSPTAVSNASFNLETRSLNIDVQPTARVRQRGTSNGPPSETASAIIPPPSNSHASRSDRRTTSGSSDQPWPAGSLKKSSESINSDSQIPVAKNSSRARSGGPPLASRSRAYRQASIMSANSNALGDANLAPTNSDAAGAGAGASTGTGTGTDDSNRLRRSTESLDTALKKLEAQTAKQGTSLHESCLKKGWLYKLTADGKTQTKHWFVLNGNSLKYYRDSRAEELQEADGRIDLASCDRVQALDNGKNFPFQLTTRLGVYTLSAMTSGIRANWLICLQKCINMSKSSQNLRASSNQSSQISLQGSSNSLTQSQSGSKPAAPDSARSSREDVGVYFLQRASHSTNVSHPDANGAVDDAQPAQMLTGSVSSSFAQPAADRRRRSRLSDTIAMFENAQTAAAPQAQPTSSFSRQNSLSAQQQMSSVPSSVAAAPPSDSFYLSSSPATDGETQQSRTTQPKARDHEEFECDAEVSEILANAPDLGRNEDAAPPPPDGAQKQAAPPPQTQSQVAHVSAVPMQSASRSVQPQSAVAEQPKSTSTSRALGLRGSSVRLDAGELSTMARSSSITATSGSAFVQLPHTLSAASLQLQLQRSELEKQLIDAKHLYAQQLDAAEASRKADAERHARELESLNNRLSLLERGREEVERFFSSVLEQCQRSDGEALLRNIAPPPSAIVRNAGDMALALRSHTAQLRDTAARCDALRAERDALRTQKAATDAYAHEIETDVFDARQRAKRAEDELAITRRERDELHERLRAVEAQLRSANDELSASNERGGSLQQQLNTASREHTAYRQAAEAKVLTVEAELNTKSNELDAVIRQLHELQRLLSNRLQERQIFVDGLLDFLDDADADTDGDSETDIDVDTARRGRRSDVHNENDSDDIVAQYRRLFVVEPTNLAEEVASLTAEERASAFLNMLYNPNALDESVVQSESDLLALFATVYRHSYKLVRYFLFETSVDFMNARGETEELLRNENRMLRKQLAAADDEQESRFKQVVSTLDSLLSLARVPLEPSSASPSPLLPLSAHSLVVAGAVGKACDGETHEALNSAARSVAHVARIRQQLDQLRTMYDQFVSATRVLNDALRCAFDSEAAVDGTKGDNQLALVLGELRRAERAAVRLECELALARSRTSSSDALRCEELSAKLDSFRRRSAQLVDEALRLTISLRRPQSPLLNGLRESVSQLIGELLHSYDGELDLVAQPKLGALVTPPPSASALTDRSAAQLANDMLATLNASDVNASPGMSRLDEATRAFLDSALSSAKLASLAVNQDLLTADDQPPTNGPADRLRQLRALIYLQSKVHSAVLQKLAVPHAIVRAHGDAAALQLTGTVQDPNSNQLALDSGVVLSPFKSIANAKTMSESGAPQWLAAFASRYANAAFDATVRLRSVENSNQVCSALLACLQRCARVLLGALRELDVTVTTEQQRAALQARCATLGRALHAGTTDVHAAYDRALEQVVDMHVAIDSDARSHVDSHTSALLVATCCLVNAYISVLDAAAQPSLDVYHDDTDALDASTRWNEFASLADRLVDLVATANKAALVDGLEKRVVELEAELAAGATKCSVSAHAKLEKEAESLRTQLRYIKDDYDGELWRTREAHRRELSRVRDEATRAHSVQVGDRTVAQPTEQTRKRSDAHVQADVPPAPAPPSAIVWMTPPPFALNESQIRKRFNEQIADVRSLLERNFTRIEEIRRETLEQIDERHRDELEKMHQNQDLRISLEERKAKNELEALLVAHESALQIERARYQNDLAAMRSQDEVDALTRQHVEQIALLRAQLQQLTEQFSIKCIEKSVLEQRVDYIERLATQSPGADDSLDDHTATAPSTSPYSTDQSAAARRASVTSAPATSLPVMNSAPLQQSQPPVVTNEREANRLKSMMGTVGGVLGMTNASVTAPSRPPPAPQTTSAVPQTNTGVTIPLPPPTMLGTREQRRSLVREQRPAAQAQASVAASQAATKTDKAPAPTGPAPVPTVDPRRLPENAGSENYDSASATVNRRRLIDRDSVPIVSRRSYYESEQPTGQLSSAEQNTRAEEAPAALASSQTPRIVPIIRTRANANVNVNANGSINAGANMNLTQNASGGIAVALPQPTAAPTRTVTGSVPAAPRVRRNPGSSAPPPSASTTAVVHSSAPTAL